MHIFSRSTTATLSLGLIGLLFAPLLFAKNIRPMARVARTCISVIARPATVSEAGGWTGREGS